MTAAPMRMTTTMTTEHIHRNGANAKAVYHEEHEEHEGKSKSNACS